MAKLKTDLKQAHFVDWITYAHVLKEGQCGLGEYVAECYGLPKRADLLDADNDTHYIVDVQAEEDPDNEVIPKLKKYNGVEAYYLHYLLCDMCAKGWLKPGTYVVTLSW